MAEYQDPPIFPTPVSREELGQNQTAYLNYFNTAFERMYETSEWHVGFIPWLESTKDETYTYYSVALDAKTRAVSAEQNAEMAWNNIENYVLPTEVTYSTDLIDEMNNSNLTVGLGNRVMINLIQHKGE